MPAGSPAPFRWGILGAASIALRTVIPATQRSRTGRVEAIASRTLAKAQAAASQSGVAKAYGSYEELLADPDIDAVYNPLPNHLHVPWSIKALDAGKHVLCEKPIAMTAGEARALRDARDRTGLQVAEAFMVRCHPQWARVKSLVGEGRIGTLELISGHFSYGARRPEDVRARVEYGGGALLDIGCYPITMSRWLFGAEPEAVAATIERDPDYGVDQLTSAVLRYSAGQASVTCGGRMGNHQRMTLYGTAGRIEVELPFTPHREHICRLMVGDGPSLETIEVPAADQYALQADQFAAAVQGNGTVPVTMEDAIGNMAVIDAVFRAAESGGWERPAVP